MEGVAGVDAQLGEGVGQVAGAAAPADGGEARLLGVQGGGQRRGEVQAGQVREGAPRVQRQGDMGAAGLLVRGGEDTEGKRAEMG